MAGNVEKLSSKIRGSYISEDSGKRRWNCPVVLVLIFLKLDFILAALVTLVGYYSLQDAYYNLPALKTGVLEDVPVYCEDLSLGPDDDEETFNTKKGEFRVSVNDHGRYICTYTSSKLKQAVNKVVERSSRLRVAKGLDGNQYLSCGNKSLSPRSGYLTATCSCISPRRHFEGNAVDQILHWDKHPERFYMDSHIHYQDGKITIPETRTYFIYASVHFNIFQRQGNRPFKFSLRICRTLHGYEKTLLGKTEMFNVSKDSGISSLNVGSYIQMSRKDVIYVKVSNANAIIRESKGNTFGIFPL